MACCLTNAFLKLDESTTLGVSLLTATIVAGCAGGPVVGSPSIPGHISDVPTYLDVLRNSPEGSLIIEVAGTPDFLQFTGTSTAVELDLPLVTARQKALEPAIRSTAEELGLSIRSASGSDGVQFLDISLDGTPEATAAIVEQFLRRLFHVDNDTPLSFTCLDCSVGPFTAQGTS